VSKEPDWEISETEEGAAQFFFFFYKVEKNILKKKKNYFQPIGPFSSVNLFPKYIVGIKILIDVKF